MTDPNHGELHTFLAPTQNDKVMIVNALHTQMRKWQETLGKKRKEKEEQKKMWDGVRFEIPLTVPVRSSTEKEFTVHNLFVDYLSLINI